MKILLEKLKEKLRDSNAILAIVGVPLMFLAALSLPVLGIISGRICKEAAYESGSVFGVIALAICFGIVYETTIGFGEAISYSHRYGIAVLLLFIYTSFAVYMNNSMIQSEREEQEKKPLSKFY